MYKTRSKNIQRSINRRGRKHRSLQLRPPQPIIIEGIFRRWVHNEQEIGILYPEPRKTPIYLIGKAQVQGLRLGERVRLYFRDGKWHGVKPDGL